MSPTEGAIEEDDNSSERGRDSGYATEDTDSPGWIKPILLAIIGAVLLLIALLTGYIAYQQFVSGQSWPSILLVSLASAFSAVGTLILAYFTYNTVVESQRQSEEMKKERKHREKRELRPFIETILSEIIVPARETLDSNIETLDSSNIEWDPESEEVPISRVMEGIDQVDTTAERIFKSDHTDTYNRLQSYNSSLNEFKSGLSRIQSELEGDPLTHLRGRDLSVLQYTPDPLTEEQWLVYLVMNGFPTELMYEPSTDIPDLLYKDIGRLGSHVHGKIREGSGIGFEVVNEKEELREDLLSESKELREHLHSEERRLMEKYWISEDDIEKGA